jgi:DNA-binding MarR family transcriptional regulator
LVAFTIEFDNEFERQMPHRTTNHGSTNAARDAPWLVSMVMWLQFMRFVPDNGRSIGELRQMLGANAKSMNAWLIRMGRWWGYVAVEGGTVRPTAGGRKAQAIWQSLTGTIEKRWQERFGRDEVSQLWDALLEVARHLAGDLPDALPILGYGLYSRRVDNVRSARTSEVTLPMLLSRVLLAFAVEFERGSEISLAISANVLRLGEGIRVRDLPRLAAVSKEAIATSLSFLEKRGYAAVEPESAGSRVRVLSLTVKGKHARDEYLRLVWGIEERWEASFGKNVGKLRELLERLVGEPTASQSPLFRGLEPYPDGWRATIPRPEGLPHYPMILHRGGFPDGS